MIWIIPVSIILSFFIGIVLFLKLNPAFGGKPNKKQISDYKKSHHYSDGKFINEVPADLKMSLGKVLGILLEFIKGVPDKTPEKPLSYRTPALLLSNKLDANNIRLTWLGHSAYLLEIGEKIILLDPMLGPSAGPHRAIGPKRFKGMVPFDLEELPGIDMVILSHDHFDHLDYGSIKKIKDKTGSFYMPLGVGAHLESWNVDSQLIHELNWWESIEAGEISLVCTPARHFSGRGFNDRFSTLWCSWVIQTPDHRIYFNGDSGYGPHFEKIGEKYGPFDIALIECGQYNEKWKDVHMMPEESVQAAIDLKAKVMTPIHWGAFSLALHSWYDPVVRVTKEAREKGLEIIVPRLGESYTLSDFKASQTDWWNHL